MTSFLIFETALLMIVAIISVLVSKIMSEQQPVDKAEVYSTAYWVGVIVSQLIFVVINTILFTLQCGIVSSNKDQFMQYISHFTQVGLIIISFVGVIIIPILKQSLRAEDWLKKHESSDTGKHAEQSSQQKSNAGRIQHHQAVKPTPGLVVKSVVELLKLTDHDADEIQNRSKN